MTGNDYLFPPRTRNTDPETSHQAVASISPLRMTENRKAVLDLFAEAGPMIDEEFLDRYDRRDIEPHQSTSGLRTRRSELVMMGMLRDSGTRRANRNGRECIVWEVAK